MKPTKPVWRALLVLAAGASACAQTTWVPLPVGGPLARAFAAAAYDPGRRVTVLYGPFPAAVRGGSVATLDWNGSPFQPFLLFGGALSPVPTTLGCLGIAAIGTPPGSTNVVLLLDGLSNPAFVLDAAGARSLPVLVPAVPPGPLFDVQGLVLAPPGSPCAGRLTAAFTVSVF